jgi:hypothetical protein
MSDVRSLRKAIRRILLEAKPITGMGYSVSSEPYSGFVPEMRSSSPVETAVKILTLAKNDPNIFGQDLSASIKASRFEPEKLLALVRVATGRPARSDVKGLSDSEMAALQSAIDRIFSDQEQP